MAFVSDGSRTWDSDRQYELVVGNRSREDWQFKFVRQNDSIQFRAEVSVGKIKSAFFKEKSENVNSNNFIKFLIYLHSNFPDQELSTTRSIIKEALTSFEYHYGIDRINGRPAGTVICEFAGEAG